MQYFHEEEQLGKAYDARLMKRLLAYAKPYWALVLFSIFLLLLITGTELARPLLIQMAIDDHINAYDVPYVALPANEVPEEAIELNGRFLYREDWFEDEPPPGERFQVIRAEGEYFLIPGVISRDTQREVEEINGIYNITTPEENFTGFLLEGEELRQFRSKDISSVIRLGLIFLLIISLGFVLNYAQVYMLQYTGQKIVYDIRQELFDHMENLPLSFFDGNPVGRLVTRVTNDTQTLHEMYTAVLVNLFRDIFMLVGIIIVMVSLNWRLALISFAVLPLIFAVTVIFRIKARDAYRQVRVKLARINAFFSENISGMRIVQIFKQEARKFKEFDHINTDHFKASMRELKVFAVFRPSMEVLYAMGVALILWFGGGSVLQGVLEFGVLYAFINYMEQFFRPINDLTEKYNILQSAMASAERIFMIKDRDPVIKDPVEPKPLTTARGKIEFKNVWFAYQEDEWVLRDISFSIEPGETVALVGATGAGKSSIINLLSRFYDIQKGNILLDGTDIRNYSTQDLRRNIGLVLQDVFIFSGTIKDNIRLNNKEITDQRIQEVSRLVNAHTFIEKLPEKYDEEVMERGSTFSSGQRQLLAFARALAFDPAVLVLDEATANIDTETEILIQDALPKLMAGRTNIVVAHRLSTIQNADKIIVMHKGKIREMGNHQELLDQKGFYYNLYLLQYKEDFQDEIGKASS